jgi:hypothetical protein
MTGGRLSDLWVQCMLNFIFRCVEKILYGSKLSNYLSSGEKNVFSPHSLLASILRLNLANQNLIHEKDVQSISEDSRWR